MALTYAFLLVALVMSTSSAAPLDELERLLEDLIVLEDLKDVLSEKRATYIAVDPAVVAMYNDMKLRSVYKWITFKIEDKTLIVRDDYRDGDGKVDNAADKKAWYNLVGKLTNTPRYILFDTRFTNGEGRDIHKIFFMFWCPDDANIGDKMIYASAKDTIKKSFTGLRLEFQGDNKGEMAYDPIKEEVERKSK